MKFIKFFTAIIFLVFIGCKHKSTDVVRSFCYWKTSLSFDGKSDTLVKDLGVKHLYVRYFDVDWNPYAKQAKPVATIKYIDFNDTNVQITPSIYITNDVVLNANKQQLDGLSSQISKRINQISESYFSLSAERYASKIANDDYEKQTSTDKKLIDVTPIVAQRKLLLQKNITDLLIDCDWSEKSRDNYFYLLKKIKSNFPNYKIEATIRLWQYKYLSKCGVPPVDSGLLMCYNMTNPEDRKTENSIGTNNELKKYITHDKYKLKLNIALPLFSWSVVFRGNQFKGILGNDVDIYSNNNVFKKSGDNKFILQDDVSIGNLYLRNGDEIRIEKVSNTEIKNMISTIKIKIKIDNKTRITFFSFDKKYINDYGTQNINDFYKKF